MTSIYWHNLLNTFDFSDVRNYSTGSDGTGIVSPDIAVTAVDDAPAVGLMTITVLADQTLLFVVPGQMIIKNNVGLGADVTLTINAQAFGGGNTVFTVDQDITGIDVSGILNRISLTGEDDVRFDGTGTGANNDVHIRAPGNIPAFDTVNSVYMDTVFTGRARAFQGIRELLILGSTSQFTLKYGIDRRFGGSTEYTSGWTWKITGALASDRTWQFGNELIDQIYTSQEHPYIIPNIENSSDVNLTIGRIDSTVTLFVRAINNSVICDTAFVESFPADINFDEVNLVMPLQNGLLNLDNGTVLFLNGAVLILGVLQRMDYSTDVVASDTLPTDGEQLWIPQAFFLHDWNASFDLSESYQTNQRTAVSTQETRRGVVDKPFRIPRMDCQAWNDGELLYMQSHFNRASTARTLQPLYCDIAFTLDVITPTTAPIDQDQYPDGVAIPADGTVLVMDYSRMDIRYARFYKGMRVLIYDPTDSANTTRLIKSFEINSIVNVWGLYKRSTPGTFTTIWLETAVTKTYPVGTRIIPLVEVDVVFKGTSDVMNAEIATFSIDNTETIGQSQLPSIVKGNVLTSQDINDEIGIDDYAIWPVSNGSAKAPAAPVIPPDTANFSVSPKRNFMRPGQFAHIGKGNVPQIYGSRILNEYDIEATFVSRESAWAFITMYHSRRGRLNRVYVVSPWEDYTATALTGVSVTIQKNGDLIDFQIRPFIAFRLNGSISTEWIVRRVTGLIDDTDTITLIWTEPLPEGATLSLSDLYCVRSAFLGRLRDDEVLQNWIKLDVVEFSLTFQDLGPELDDDVTAIAGLWEIAGYEVIKDTGAFTNVLDTITITPGTYYGTMEAVARELLTFEIDTDSTCIIGNVFWPQDEIFEILKVTNYRIEFDGVSFIDIGMGERTGCTVNNYDYDDFVIRIFFTFKEALWNRRLPAVVAGDPVCLPPEVDQWKTADYKESLIDSWQLPAVSIPDYGVNGFPLTFVNPKSDNLSTVAIVNIFTNRSAPDGVGIAAMNQPQQYIGDLQEKFYADTSATLNQIMDGSDAWAHGGWVAMNWVVRNFDTWTVMASAGRYWGGSTVPAGSYRLLGYVDGTNMLSLRVKFRAFTYFAGSGISDIETDYYPRHNKSYFVWVQQDATSFEIWVDGVLAASDYPVGATGVDIYDEYSFKLFGHEYNFGGQGWRGGMGSRWPIYNSFLNKAGVTSQYRSAENFDFVNKDVIDDIGDCGSPYSLAVNNTSAREMFPEPPVDDLDKRLMVYRGLNQMVRQSIQMCRRVFQDSQKTECQFKYTLIPPAGTAMMIGYDGGHYADSHTFFQRYLGYAERQMGFDLSDGRVYIGAVVQNAGPFPNPVLINETVTIRIDPDSGSPSNPTYTILVNNAVRYTASIPASVWTWYGGIVFAMGNYYQEEDKQGEITILKPSEYTFPLGAGYTFIRSM